MDVLYLILFVAGSIGGFAGLFVLLMESEGDLSRRPGDDE